MKSHSRFFAAAAAALLLSAPVVAQGQGNHDNHGQGGQCPHFQGIETSVSQALALLDQAKTQTGDQAKATAEKARLKLTEAQKQMGACEKMCETRMGQGHGNHAGHGAAVGAKAERVTDPVCGMKIDPKTAAGKSVYAGKTYYFCSADEKAKFDKDPAKYVKKQG